MGNVVGRGLSHNHFPKMGIEGLKQFVRDLQKELKLDGTPNQIINFYRTPEKVDVIIEDIMTRLYSLKHPDGTSCLTSKLTGREIFESVFYFYVDLIEINPNLDIVILADKPSLKPVEKTTTQRDRDQRWLFQNDMDGNPNEYYPDNVELVDEGLRFPDGHTEPIDMQRFMHTRAIRYKLFEYLYRTAQEDDLWNECLRARPHARVAIDICDGQPAVACIPTQGWEQTKFQAQYGEGDLAVFAWMKHLLQACDRRHFSIVSTDSDMLLLSCLHFWDRGDVRVYWKSQERVYWDVRKFIDLLKKEYVMKTPFNLMIASICAGCDYFNQKVLRTITLNSNHSEHEPLFRGISAKSIFKLVMKGDAGCIHDLIGKCQQADIENEDGLIKLGRQVLQAMYGANCKPYRGLRLDRFSLEDVSRVYTKEPGRLKSKRIKYLSHEKTTSEKAARDFAFIFKYWLDV